MSLILRRLFLCLIGLLAGLAAWPAAEALLLQQAGFDSFLLFSAVLGLIFGLLMGGFFGTSEGITLSIRPRVWSGMLTGALVGLVGGVIGFLAGQAMLFFLGEVFVSSADFRQLGFPLARAVGWAFLGMFVGSVEGFRSRSRTRLRIGILGGLVGGLLGGLALEYMRLLIADIMLARLVGLLLFGLLIGFFYGLVENRLSAGVLRLLNGRFKGKEFLLTQRRIRIGGSPRNDIQIAGYTNVLEEHALLSIKEHRRKNEITIKSINPALPVTVNDQRCEEGPLTTGDVIRLGTATLLLREN